MHDTTHALVEHEARQQRRALFRRQFIEGAGEKELRNAAFLLDDILVGKETESPEDPFARTELVEVEDGVGGGDFAFCRSDLRLQFLLR
ncbi:hypothetical protein RTBOTA2_005764 [Rhodotorula toruloides]|nr:hypothetical protein RTBOTA2_005764 [Rhodotorula toruloides]